MPISVIQTEPRFETYPDPRPDQLGTQDLYDLVVELRDRDLYEKLIRFERAPAPSTIGRIIRGDPTVMHSTKQKLWKVGHFLIDRQEWQQRPRAGGRRPVQPVDQPELSIFEALWFSVRTYPCSGQLHIYGWPYDRLFAEVYRPSNNDPLLIRTMQSWSVCPHNQSTHHLPDSLVAELAGRVGLTHNIWKDPLVLDE